MATIRKYTKKDGSTAYMFNAYLGVDSVTGKKKRTTKRGFKSPKEAKLALARLEISIEENGIETRLASTFKEMYEFWLEQHQNTVSTATKLRIETNFKHHILPKFGSLNIEKINTAYCQKCLNEWYSYYVNYSILKSYTQKVFDFSISMKMIKENPMRSVIMPRKKEKLDDDKIENYFNVDELKEFFSAFDLDSEYMDFVICRVLAFTGLRKGELMALTWNDIDFSDQTLNVNKSLSYQAKKLVIVPPKNKNSKRLITLDDKTIYYLKKWKNLQASLLLSVGINVNKTNTVQPIFTQLITDHGKNIYLHYDYVNYILRKKAKQRKTVGNEIKLITPHGFRHTHASLLFESGASVKEVQDRLGHANAQITLDIYTHVTKQAKDETANRYAAYANF